MLNCCWGKTHPEYKKARSFPFNISVPMIHKEYLICNGCAATTITKIFPSLLLHPPIFVLVQDAFCVVTSDILTSLLLYFLDSLWSPCFEWLNQGISITFAWKAHVFESSHGGFLKWRSPIAGWLIIENPIPMDDLGVPLWLRKPSSNYHISLNNAVLVGSNPNLIRWKLGIPAQALSRKAEALAEWPRSTAHFPGRCTDLCWEFLLGIFGAYFFGTSGLIRWWPGSQLLHRFRWWKV